MADLPTQDPIQSPLDSPSVKDAFSQTELGQYLQQRDQPKTKPVNPALAVNPMSQFATEDFSKQLIAQGQQATQGAYDPLEAARTHAIGVGTNTGNFERYYSHPLFKQLGYDPYRDNETAYNEKATGAQDFSRMMTQWPALFNLGAKDMWQEIFDPGISNDVENSRAMSKGMSAGTSNKGGVGGWLTNFGINTAYTAGIMGEMAAEELVLAGATLVTGGLDAELTLPMMAARAGKGAKAIYEGAKSLTKIKDAFTAITDFNKAKQIFDLSKAGAKGMDLLKSAGKFINPLEHTTELIHDTKGWDELANFAGMKKTAGALWRDMREVRAVTSESRLEGGSAQTQTTDELVQAYYDKFGKMPEGEEARKITEAGQAAGFATAMANIPAIYLSNKIVFETAFKGFKPVEKILADEESNINGRIIRGDKNWKKAGKDPFERVTNYSKKGIYDRLRPANILKGSMKYGMANLSEGLQESAQDAISSATRSYYEDQYKDPALAAKRGLTSYILDGLGTQMSAQGLDTFMSGFLMGGALQGPQNLVFKGAPQLASKIFTPKKYAAAKTAREENTNKVFNAMNEVAKNPGLATDILDQNTTAQTRAYKHVTDAQAEGDQKAFEDGKVESMFNHVHTLLQTGKFHVLMDQIDGLKQMSDNDLADAFNQSGASQEEKGALRDRLNNFEKRANEVKARYDWVDENIDNKFDRKDPRQFQAYLATEDVKKMAVFSRFNFDRVLERMTSITNDAAQNKPLSKASSIDFTLLFDKVHVNAEIKRLQDEIKIYSEATTPGSKTTLKQKQEKLDALRELNSDLAVYSSMVKRRDSAQVSPVAAEELQSEARFTPGTSVKLKNGTTATIKKILPNGKVRLVEVKGTHPIKNLTFVKASAQTQIQEEDPLVSHTGRLYDSYKRYIKAIANTTGDHIIDSNVEKSFRGLKDFYELKHDSDQAAQAINLLTNPEYVNEYISRVAKAREEAAAQKEELMRQALKEYMNRMGNNELLNDLYNAGAFIHPNEIDALLNENKIPLTFIDTITLKPIDYASEKYKKIEEILNAYAAKTGQELTQKPIVGAEPQSQFQPFSRNKFKGDRRTYKDYAEEFGFDPEALSSDVPLIQVLETIIRGEYTSVAEKALAKRFLMIAKPEDILTFKKNNPYPGHYAPVSKELVVDARYNSSDYAGGSIPIEFLILHEIGHKHTVDALDTDETFRADIEKLLQKAQLYTTTKAYREQFGDKPLYGTKNTEEFATEALSNQNFQAMLRSIPHDVTTRSTWDELLFSIKRMFARLFGVTETNTLLDQAVGIITAKIDRGDGPVSTEETSPTGPQGTKGISIATPIEKMPKELVNELVQAYRAYNNALDAEEQEPLDSMTDAIVSKTEKFKNLIQGGLPVFTAIVSKYGGPEVAPVKQEPTGKLIPEREVETIPQAEAFRFAEDGFVSPERLQSIAQKLFDNQRLTPLEQQFYTDKFKDIDTIMEELQNKKETGALTTLEDKKADIEKRRQAALNSIREQIFNNGSRWAADFEKEGLTSRGAQLMDGHSEDTKEKLVDWINTKYDTELAELLGEKVIVPEVETPEKIIEKLEIPEKEVPRPLQERFDEVKTLDDYNELKDFLLEDIIEGLITDVILVNKMLDDKLKELSKSVNFETIKEQNILVMKDKKFFGPKGQALVIEKTAKEIKVRKLGEVSGSVRVISANQVQDEVEFKFNEGMDQTVEVPTITPEDEKVANNNIKTVTDLLKDKVEIDKLHDQATTQSKEDIDKDFFDDLDPCE